MSGKHVAKYKKFAVPLASGVLTLYVGSRIRSALHEVSVDLDLYQGVRLGQVLQAVYEQGLKDGRREIIESFEHNIKAGANYLPPGRPKRKTLTHSR